MAASAVTSAAAWVANDTDLPLDYDRQQNSNADQFFVFGFTDDLHSSTTLAIARTVTVHNSLRQQPESAPSMLFCSGGIFVDCDTSSHRPTT
jgi:hypothetical protein